MKLDECYSICMAQNGVREAFSGSQSGATRRVCHVTVSFVKKRGGKVIKVPYLTKNKSFKIKGFFPKMEGFLTLNLVFINKIKVSSISEGYLLIFGYFLAISRDITW